MLKRVYKQLHEELKYSNAAPFHAWKLLHFQLTFSSIWCLQILFFGI